MQALPPFSVSTSESTEYSVIASNLLENDQHTFSVTATPSPPAPESNDEPKPNVSDLINRKVVATANNTFTSMKMDRFGVWE